MKILLSETRRVRDNDMLVDYPLMPIELGMVKEATQGGGGALGNTEAVGISGAPFSPFGVMLSHLLASLALLLFIYRKLRRSKSDDASSLGSGIGMASPRTISDSLARATVEATAALAGYKRASRRSGNGLRATIPTSGS